VSPTYVLDHRAGSANPAVSSGPVGYTPAQIRHAYGFDQVPLNGAGQTIAIVDAYDDPTITADLHAFDQHFGLADPVLTKVNEYGGTSYPAPNADWAVEISLDVEWAHAIAPGASILLVEANSNSYSDLMTAVNYARNQAGVSVLSMSWGGSEFQGETGYDAYFITPSDHQGVTFVASSGDAGTIEYPAASPNVLSVGGTTLTIGPGNTHGGETAWSGSGGGISAYEPTPSYQLGGPGKGWRTNPDVAYDANPYTGFALYDSCSFGSATPWIQIGGTSAGAPQWAALVALADQGRSQRGLASLDGRSQTLPLLYDMPNSVFHDIISGSNAQYSAGPGYDLVTGFGTPVANQTVAGLEQLNWSSLGGGVSAITVVALPEGGQEVFAIATSADPANGASPGAVWTRTQAVPGGPWSDWTCLYGSVSAITVAKEANGDIELFGIATSDHAVYTKTQNASTGIWSPNWFGLGGPVSAITVGTESNGNPELFAIATIAYPAPWSSGPGAVWTRTQDATTGIWAPSWSCLYGSTSAIAVGTDSHGNLELFGIANTAGDGIWSKTLDAAIGTWSSSWSALDFLASAITVDTNSNGSLQVFAIGFLDQALWTRRVP
jgi:subtilase family serine protease